MSASISDPHSDSLNGASAPSDAWHRPQATELPADEAAATVAEEMERDPAFADAVQRARLEAEAATDGNGASPAIDEEITARIFELLALDSKDVRVDTDAAIDFLRAFHPEDAWHLVAIGSVEGRSFAASPEQAAAARNWIAARPGVNIYFHVNQLKGSPANGKASKDDVAAGLWLHVDLDLPRSLDWSDFAAIRNAVLVLIARLNDYPHPPTIIVWSGGGLQAYWKLAEPFHINGDAERAAEFERYTRQLAADLGADACFNCDRIMRVAGTVNIPTPAKRARGRRCVLSALLVIDLRRTYGLDQFPARPACEKASPQPDGKPNGAGTNGGGHSDDGTTTREEILRRLPDWLRTLIGQETGRKGDRSDHCHHVMQALFEHGLTVGEVRVMAVSSPFAAKFVSRGDLDAEIARAQTKWKESGGKRSGSADRDDQHTNGEKGERRQEDTTHDRTDAWPDPVPLPRSLLPVAPFDFDMLPESVRPWVTDVCERMQCPPDYVAVSVMAGLGSVIGCKVTVRPQREDDWSVVGNQWPLCIGRPGVMKSPAMEEALRPLKMLAAVARERFNMAKAEHDMKVAAGKARSKNADKEAAKILAKNKLADIDNLFESENVDEPTLKRYVATNASVEALGVLLQQNPNGLLVHRDEMLSLLDRLDQEGHADEKGFYLTGWAGDSAYTFDRIGRGLDLHVDAVCLSMLGGTQPGRISQYLVQVRRGGRGDDGLIQRFGLMVWPDIPASWTNVDRKPNREARDGAFRVFQDLDGLDWHVVGAKRDFGPTGDEEGIPNLRLSTEANERFVAWRTELERRLRQAGLHPALESHLAKYRKLVPGLALICHLADGGKGEVTYAAIDRALKWAAYLETHAARVYASTTIASADAARAIVAKIKSGHLKEQFGSREVWRPQWSLLTDRDTVHAALELLVDYDWLGANTVPTSGRPATVYTVNPKALAQ